MQRIHLQTYCNENLNFYESAASMDLHLFLMASISTNVRFFPFKIQLLVFCTRTFFC